MLRTDKIEIITYDDEQATLVENCLATFTKTTKAIEEEDRRIYCTELNEVQATFLAELVDYENSDVEFIYPEK